MVHNANSADNLADLFRLLETLDIAGVANHERGAGFLLAAANSADLAILIEEHFVDGLIEHVGSAVDGAKARETFGETAETVDRVEERRVSVFADRFDVELHFLESLHAGAHTVVVVDFERDGVTQKVNRVFLEGILLEKDVHLLLGEINVAPG